MSLLTALDDGSSVTVRLPVPGARKPLIGAKTDGRHGAVAGLPPGR